MVVDKLFEFIEDIERFCVNHRWSRFFNDWETGDEALDEYAMIYKNCCNDVDEEKDAANDIFTELTEYMDCLYNYIDVDYVKLLDDEKQNARKWLDKVEKVIGSCVFSLKGNDLKGFLIKGYQMCHLIKEAAVKTPDEYYGGRRTDVMPYYIGENKNQLFNNILNEDNMGKLDEKRIELGNPYPVKKNEIIDLVERSSRLTYTATDSKTIQLYIYSNGSDRPEAFAEVEITSVGYILHGAEGYDYQGSSFKEFENDLKDIVFNFDAVMSKRFGENKKQLFDSILNEADDIYKAKVNGKRLKGNKLVKDKKDADTFESKTEPTQHINQMKKDGKLNKNAKPNIVKESHIALFDDLLKEYLLEDIEDFPKNTRAMYRFAKRRHDDTGAIRKVSKQPYWVHPEGVAKIVMEHGGSDIEIKAAMAHDTMEDTGESYEDMVEKFGEKVASIVKEVTNDKDEIAKVGKEKYISEELCRLSPEALTVKLADMLYNMKDSPTEKNYERMRKNVAFLMMNRKLDGKHLELAQEIMEV